MKRILKSVLAAILITATFGMASLSSAFDVSADTTAGGEVSDVIPGLTDGTDTSDNGDTTNDHKTDTGSGHESMTMPATNIPSDTGTTPGDVDSTPENENQRNTSAVIGVIIAVVAVIAVVILIIALVPKRKK